MVLLGKITDLLRANTTVSLSTSALGTSPTPPFLSQIFSTLIPHPLALVFFLISDALTCQF
jgi:hypothetical protein